MAPDGEFKIKGAAQKEDLSKQPKAEHMPEQQEESADKNPVAEDQAEEVQEKEDEEEGEVKEQKPTDEELKIKHRWFKCEADPAAYGPKQQYYVHADTQESRWTEPDEPYWIYDVETGLASSDGLQYPKQAQASREDTLRLKKPAEVYMGYNPKIHGDYDPNADYAQWHNQKRAEEEASVTNPFATAHVPGQTSYESTMALNRFSGSVQKNDLGPERHSDTAKSGRQMNAFFDVDAAANAHDGRSLREERKAKKLSKEEVKAFNQARHEKKQKKRMAFYKS